MTFPIKIYRKTNYFSIDWTINTLCTYHCSYCPDMLHRGRNIIFDKNKDKLIIKQFLEKLYNQIKGRPTHVFLNGGEPTISPYFIYLIDIFKDYGWYCHVNTNCTRTTEWWIQNAPKLFKATISFHPEWDNPNIFEKVKTISELTNVGVFVLMYPPYWEKAKQAFYNFVDIPTVAHVGISRVFKRKDIKNDTSYDYSEDQLEWFKNNSGIKRPYLFDIPKEEAFGHVIIENADGSSTPANEKILVNNRQNTFINWNCNMAIDHIHINGEGLIKGAACNQGKDLGTLETFESLNTAPTHCKQIWCNCTIDTLIPKYKII